VLECLQTGVYFIDRSHRILFWNEGAEKITGHLRQDVLGRNIHEVLQPTDEDESEATQPRDSIVEVLKDGRPSISEVMLRHKAGHLVPARMRAVAIRNDHGTIIGAAESFEESVSAADWERRQEKLAGYGALDPTTGVLTENFLLSHLRESLRTFADCQVPFSVAWVHIERVEDIVARYGPGILPVLLRSVGQSLENSLRPTDFLGRKGEWDFMAILTECSRFDVDKVSERLKKSVQGVGIPWWGDRLHVAPTVGAATVQAEDTIESLMARVDHSMDRGTAGGGNRKSA